MIKDLNAVKAELEIDLSKEDNSSNLGTRIEKLKQIVKKGAVVENNTYTLVQQEATKIFNNLKFNEIEDLVSIIIENMKMKNYVKELEEKIKEIQANHSFISESNVIELPIKGNNFSPSITTFVYRNFAKFEAFICFEIEENFKYGIDGLWWVFTLNSKAEDFNKMTRLIDIFVENWTNFRILSLVLKEKTEEDILWD